MNVEFKLAHARNLNRSLLVGSSFEVIRSNANYANHSIVLKSINEDNHYTIINTPTGTFGELYASIIANNEIKYSNKEYLDINDISRITSNFCKNFPDYHFELIIGLSLSMEIQSDNIRYFGKTYEESDYIYEFPGDMYMCMAANDCEPDKIYIMVGGLGKNDN